MLTKNQIIEFLLAHKEYLNKNFNITKIGLFGSFARNENNENSDIDLLIELKKNTSNIFDKKLELQEFIKKQLNRDVDICREKYLKPYAKSDILKEVQYV